MLKQINNINNIKMFKMYSSNIYLHCVSLIHKPMLVSIKSISIFLLCVLKSSWGPPQLSARDSLGGPDLHFGNHCSRESF